MPSLFYMDPTLAMHPGYRTTGKAPPMFFYSGMAPSPLPAASRGSQAGSNSNTSSSASAATATAATAVGLYPAFDSWGHYYPIAGEYDPTTYLTQQELSKHYLAAAAAAAAE